MDLKCPNMYCTTDKNLERINPEVSIYKCLDCHYIYLHLELLGKSYLSRLYEG